MKVGNTLKAVVCVAGLAAAATQTAGASEVLYNSVGFMTGQQSFSDSFSVNGPGTITVTLSDFAWPVPLSSLDLTLGTSAGLLGPEMTGPGTENFQVTGGKIFAQWFGSAGGAMDTGVYGLNMAFTPAAAPVPLPTSIALLLSGLAFLAWQRRERAGLTGASQRIDATTA